MYTFGCRPGGRLAQAPCDTVAVVTARLLILVVLTGALACAGPRVMAPEPGPSLPLPEVAPEPDATRPVSNSIRAWHYRPEMVKPLREAIGAILREAKLPQATTRMVIVVVAAANGCFY